MRSHARPLIFARRFPGRDSMCMASSLGEQTEPAGKTEMKNTTFTQLFTAPIFALLALSAQAQVGSFDVSVGGGLADYSGGGTSPSAKGLFEVSALYNLAAHAGLGAEYTYSPVTSNTQNFTGYTNSSSAHLDHYGAVGRFPFATSLRMEPYAAAHLGVFREVVTYPASGATSEPPNRRLTTAGMVAVVRE